MARMLSRCGCGKPKRKAATKCGACHRERMELLRAKAAEVVATGRCPDCGAPLRRNLALAGWWQCAAYPCTAMREPAFRALPPCGFQTFTA